MTATANTLDFAEARRRRAEEAEFEWSAFDGHTICTNPTTNKSYVVTETSCTCADYQYRGRTVCKHMCAANLRRLEAGL